MTVETKAKKQDRTPKVVQRVAMEHPKMKGIARVLETDIDVWQEAGWRRVKSAGNAA